MNRNSNGCKGLHYSQILDLKFDNSFIRHVVDRSRQPDDKTGERAKRGDKGQGVKRAHEVCFRVAQMQGPAEGFQNPESELHS